MAKTVTEDLMLMRCEKIVNETWSKTSLYYDTLKDIIEKGGPSTDQELTILMIAANATLQKMTLDKALDEQFLLGEEMSLCGKNPKNQCPCSREVCLMDA